MNRAFEELVEAPQDSDSSRHGAVLIVEDCEPLLFFLNSALLALGYKTQFLAANLSEAQAVWTQHSDSISHVVLNYELPDGLAFDFGSQLLRERPDVKIIITSGYDIASIRDGTASVDRFQYLQKPFRFSDLKESLEAHSPASAFCA